jgi:small subunit ribosomal protein S4e
MHQTRQESLTEFPIPRKGTKYIARASDTRSRAVPVLIAVRDILKLARTAREVQKMVNAKMLKLNGRVVRNFHESVKLFNVFEADKTYKLILLPTKKFSFEETKDKDVRLCKVIGKKVLPKNTIQLNLHDGSNVLTKEKINIEDSVYLDFSGKIKKHIAFEKGKSAFVLSGKYAGNEVKIGGVKDNLVTIKLKDKETIIPAGEVIVG